MILQMHKYTSVWKSLLFCLILPTFILNSIDNYWIAAQKAKIVEWVGNLTEHSSRNNKKLEVI